MENHIIGDRTGLSRVEIDVKCGLKQDGTKDYDVEFKARVLTESANGTDEMTSGHRQLEYAIALEICNRVRNLIDGFKAELVRGDVSWMNKGGAK